MTEEQLRLLIAYIRESTLARIYAREGKQVSSDMHSDNAEELVKQLLETCQ